MELTDWLGLMTPATLLGAAVFRWRVVPKAGDRARADLAEAEKRITSNADKAHAAIGERIDRLDSGLATLGKRIDGPDRKVDAIKDKLAEVRDDVPALKTHLYLLGGARGGAAAG